MTFRQHAPDQSLSPPQQPQQQQQQNNQRRDSSPFSRSGHNNNNNSNNNNNTTSSRSLTWIFWVIIPWTFISLQVEYFVLSSENSAVEAMDEQLRQRAMILQEKIDAAKRSSIRRRRAMAVPMKSGNLRTAGNYTTNHYQYLYYQDHHNNNKNNNTNTTMEVEIENRNITDVFTLNASIEKENYAQHPQIKDDAIQSQE